MCVKLLLATTLDVHPCSTMRPRILGYSKEICLFFVFIVFLPLRLKFRHKLPLIVNFYKDLPFSHSLKVLNEPSISC